MDLKVGAAIVEPLAPKAEPAMAAAPRTPPRPSRRGAGTGGGCCVRRRGGDASAAAAAHPTRPAPERVDVTIAAGESAMMHDRKSSLSVRLRFDSLCPGQGTVETGHPEHAGDGSPGRARRCCGCDRQGSVSRALRRRSGGRQPRASGVLSLVRDRGEVPLPARVGANVIEADGRRYTILYQSRPPALTLDGRRRPAA